MTGFEDGSSGIGSDSAVNCATTTVEKVSTHLSALKLL